MYSIDFYILESTDPRNRLLVVCRLSEKAWHGGYRTFILTENPAQQMMIDELLWTFRAGSFIPHGLANNQLPAWTPVVIGTSLPEEVNSNLLINLKSSPVDPPDGVERIIEIIDQNEEIRRAGRERFRYYRDSGKDVKSHQISL
ncbi:MAG: DNA polymerase III subunit chi [Gammaproteobacteria bacterium]